MVDFRAAAAEPRLIRRKKFTGTAYRDCLALYGRRFEHPTMDLCKTSWTTVETDDFQPVVYRGSAAG